MARTRTVHRCSSCGTSTPKWVGRCEGCGEWNTLVEEVDVREPTTAAASPAAVATSILDVTDESRAARPTGIAEVDRVLGGGLVSGSVTLVGGEPGIGKSTLLLQVVGALAADGVRTLYVTGEESAGQIRSRAERLGAMHPDLWIAAETELANVTHHIAEVAPEVVVVDSVQTLHDPEIGSAPGSVTQVRDCANALVQVAKKRDIAMLLVGHVTKEGTLAGPRVLEHVVDTVVSFEGDRHHDLRLLRAVKHRFGPTAEIGLFRMNGAGLEAVDDPSGLFLADRVSGISGSAVVPSVEGQRPLLVEVQALVAKSALTTPRRSTQGIDHGRLAMLLAVIERRVGLALDGLDVYALAVGGARVTDPAADAGIALAVTSSLNGKSLAEDLVVIGEVGLGGELRRVTHLDRRLAEAARLGFRRAIVPVSAAEGPDGLELLWAPTLSAAHAIADISPR